MINSVILRLYLFGGLLVTVGCGGSGLVSVKGKVTYEDKPVTSGTVNFISEDGSAYGELKPDGSYELMTNEPGDGARPGTYKVTVIAMQDQGSALPEAKNPLPPPTVPLKYTSLATTDLTAEVGNKDNVINFQLTGNLGK
jgi:hypothetical protein